jgi:hypothetical protein
MAAPESEAKMSTTNDDLEKRVVALEQEVKALRGLVGGLPFTGKETPAERGAQLFREAERNRGVMAAAWAKVKDRMGIHAEPIGAERLRQMMIDEGIDPNDNSFSRGIIEMREE